MRSHKRLRCEDGASAVEYGLVVVAIAALITAIVFSLGGVVNDTYQGTCDKVQAKASTSATC